MSLEIQSIKVGYFRNRAICQIFSLKYDSYEILIAHVWIQRAALGKLSTPEAGPYVGCGAVEAISAIFLVPEGSEDQNPRFGVQKTSTNPWERLAPTQTS